MALRPPRPPLAWRGPGLAFVAFAAALLLSHRETLLAMARIWSNSDTYAHAFVVPPIVAWLIWRQRSALRRLQPRPDAWMLLPMAALAGLWWVGDAVSMNAVTQFAIVAMAVTAVPLLLGWQVARTLMFPLAFLFFAVPIGEVFTTTLMRYTADFTVVALRLSGVPVYREGLQFVIPSGNWSVVEACSGIRYLMASFMVGSLFAYLNYRSARRRCTFVAVSLVVPIVANWLRAYMIVMLGHLSDNRIATGVDHVIYGWVFFGVVIMALFLIGARWAELPARKPAMSPSSADVADAPAPWHKSWQAPVLAALAVLLITLPALPRRATSTLPPPPVLALPDALAGPWRADPVALSAWQPTFVNASLETRRNYVAKGGHVEVHLAYYRNQSETKKLVSSVNKLVRSQDTQWNEVATGQQSTSLTGGTIVWNTADLVAADDHAGAERQRLKVWHLYWIGGSWTGSDVKAKVLQAAARLRGEPDDSAALMLVADAAIEADANRLLGSFAATNLDELQRLLTQARARQ